MCFQHIFVYQILFDLFHFKIFLKVFDFVRIKKNLIMVNQVDCSFANGNIPRCPNTGGELKKKIGSFRDGGTSSKLSSEMKEIYHQRPL